LYIFSLFIIIIIIIIVTLFLIHNVSIPVMHTLNHHQHSSIPLLLLFLIFYL
jgi:hypothetical protein